VDGDKQRNHAYAVKYYAPQGTDATIYPGVIDLKFINDTPASILIWPTLKGDYLSFDFYGTKDERKVSLSTPVQFDKKADGSMKATWERSVTKDGKTKTDVFKSTYQPPALFHKEEKFIPAAPENPTTDPNNPSTTPTTTPTTTTPAPVNP
jgi:vancomycin resistance protein YoaR